MRDEFRRGNTSLSALARKYTVDRKTIREWIAIDIDDIPQYQQKKMRKIGAGRKSYYPDIDKAMLDYFRYERERCHTVTYRELREISVGSNVFK